MYRRFFRNNYWNRASGRRNGFCGDIKGKGIYGDNEYAILLPFYIFSHENKFGEYDRDAKKLGELKAEYGYIKQQLEELTLKGTIDEYTKCTIMDMAGKVLEHIADKYDILREGVKAVMGGKILEYEAKAIRNEGLKEGLKEGRNEQAMEIARRLVRLGKMSLEEIADCSGLTVFEVETIAGEERVLSN